MDNPSPLDDAHRAMTAAPDDDGARLAYYLALAATELYLLLTVEPQGDDLDPLILTAGDGPLILAFDSEERLAGFAQGPQAYAALPGRVIVALAAGKGLALGLNLATDDHAFLLAPAAIGWLADQLQNQPTVRTGQPIGWRACADAHRLGPSLSRALSGMGALAETAWLVAAVHADGTVAPALVITGAAPSDEAALAKAATEAFAFSGLAHGRADVLFLDAARITALGLRDLGHPVTLSAPPAPPVSAPHHPAPPGSDPARPPRLK